MGEAAAAAKMSFQQVAQPKSSANGFGRRSRSENKLQSGKSIPTRSTNAGLARSASGGKAGVYEGPSRDRLLYLTTCLVGHPVEVQLRNGSIYSGTCFTTNIEKEFGIILKMARMIKDAPIHGQKPEFVSKAPSKTFIIPGKEVVQVIAKDVPITMDGLSSELQNERQQDIMIDSYISQSHQVEMERELAPWIPDEDGPQYHELENIFDDHWKRGWDQFEINKQLFGVKSTFDEDLYTTKLERGPRTRELEKEAIRIAREIEGEDTQDLHLAEERGIHFNGNFDIDEETRFSSVYRVRADDCGYDEDDDIILDSCNNETFGDDPASLVMKSSADLTHGKDVDEARLLSTSSVDEAECSQSSNSTDLCQLGSYGNSRQFASEIPSKIIVSSDVGSRSLDNLDCQHGGSDSIIKGVDEEKPIEDAQVPKSNDSQYGQKEGLGKGEANRNSTAAVPPSHASLKSNEKTSSPIELSEGAASIKGTGEAPTTNNRGRPGSSTSSNSERIGTASASSGPGLSPSSSVGSLASEKSTLNPHAKEFKLNPNAKSFTPTQTPVRPPSPVSDGSFYFPTNVSTLPHLHGLPMGMGMGPSFSGHQPVIVNPQVSPLQTPQTYYHPNTPQLQYGQQMLLGHHRPVMYMPTYQPEMPYKGRDY